MEQLQRSLDINMELLLDTNTLLWTLFGDKRLSKQTQSLIGNESNTIFVSTASLWEIEIKHNKNPNLMPYSSKELFNVITGETDFIILDIRPEYILSLKEIFEQKIHNDPFDHIILATAKNEQLKLLSSDKILQQYSSLNIDIKII